MDKCSTGLCMPIASWMENKPLLIGIAVLVFSLIVGGYFWFFRKSSSAETPPQGEEPQVEEFVGRQQADFEAAQAEAQQQQGPPQEQEQPHEE
jgi:hypothetical protein